MRRNRSSICPFVIVLAIFLSASGARSQLPTPSPSTKSLEKEFFKNILRDQKAIWTAPLHLQRVDAKWMIPSSIGAMALFTTDRITGDEIGEADRQVKERQHVSYAGSVYGIGAIATTFYLV